MGRIYKKGASEIDPCAHRLYDLQQNRNKDIRWDKTAVTCWACGEKLETYYHEERLYSVRCSHCKIETAADDNVPAMLIKAGNPDKAAEIYNNRDKLAFRTKNNRRASVLANALRFSDDLYESGVRARELADRHYNRQKPGTPQFVPPGRCLVLYAETETGKAFWVTSWPYAQYVHHAWAGAWICSAFRNEGAGIASELIKEAVSATIEYFGNPPEQGFVTFINRQKVKPTMIHGQPHWGRTYELAGFKAVGETKGGLLALRLLPKDMPQMKG